MNTGAAATTGPTRRRSKRGKDARADVIIGSLTDAFEPLMQADPAGFRTKFRKMARDPFAFYRGSACVFYADMGAKGAYADVDERWVDERSSRVWIQGDLHAENFGTYLDAGGRLVFDVNDFDEAYLGHWTWDLRRFVSSLALMCWQKALPDNAIDDLVSRYVRAYVDQVHYYVEVEDDTEWALTLDNAEGGVLDALHAARMSTRFDLLESVTIVENYHRRFAEQSGVRRLKSKEEERVREAFGRYLATIPPSKKGSGVVYDVLDVVGKAGFGIGSAGLPAYNVLIEGYSQALDNDVVLTLKQGNVAAASRVVADDSAASYFDHPGHRTAISQRALQAHADRFLGWTNMPVGGKDTGFVVSEFSPYEADLDWDDVTEPDEMQVLVKQLGQATAKIHCVADIESDHDLVDFSVEEAITERVGDDVDDLVSDLTTFAHAYAEQTRDDYRLFVDSFRAGALSQVTPA